MPQFIYVIKPTRADMLEGGLTQAEEAVVQEHFAYLQDLTEEGVVVLAGRTDTTGPESFGIVVYEADDEETARGIMAADPAVAKRVMEAEFLPFRIALFGSPFAE
jgi:hypothetical protein